MFFDFIKSSFTNLTKDFGFKDWMDALTLIVIFWTATETWKARRSNNKVIEISNLPLLTIDIRFDSRNGRFSAILRNLRSSPAYDIKISPLYIHLLDVQRTWKMKLKPKYGNTIEGNGESELEMNFYENDSIIDSSAHALLFHSFKRMKNLDFLIKYRNCLGRIYFSKIYYRKIEEDDDPVIDIKLPPKTINLKYLLFFLKDEILSIFGRLKYKFVCLLEEPHLGHNEKYSWISIIIRYSKKCLKKNDYILGSLRKLISR